MFFTGIIRSCKTKHSSDMLNVSHIFYML